MGLEGKASETDRGNERTAPGDARRKENARKKRNRRKVRISRPRVVNLIPEGPGYMVSRRQVERHPLYLWGKKNWGRYRRRERKILYFIIHFLLIAVVIISSAVWNDYVVAGVAALVWVYVWWLFNVPKNWSFERWASQGFLRDLHLTKYRPLETMAALHAGASRRIEIGIIDGTSGMIILSPVYMSSLVTGSFMGFAIFYMILLFVSTPLRERLAAWFNWGKDVAPKEGEKEVFVSYPRIISDLNIGFTSNLKTNVLRAVGLMSFALFFVCLPAIPILFILQLWLWGFVALLLFSLSLYGLREAAIMTEDKPLSVEEMETLLRIYFGDGKESAEEYYAGVMEARRALRLSRMATMKGK